MFKSQNSDKKAARNQPAKGSDCGDGPQIGDKQGKAIVSLRFQEMSLRHSDVQLLQGPHTINERLIDFCYAYLQTRRYKMQPDLHFLLPELAYSMRHLEVRERRRLMRNLQLASKRFVFVPLSDGGHWSLLLVSRPDRKFYYFDSEDNRHLSLARLMHELLRTTIAAEDYAFTVGRCLQQQPGQPHESGVHLICMTDNMADYVSRCGYATSSLLVSIQEVRGKRAYLLQLIRTLGGILPLSSPKSSSSI